MVHKVTLIPGNGIGPEVIAAAHSCIDATGVAIKWDVQRTGVGPSTDNNIPALSAALLDSIQKNKVALKGPITTPVGIGMRSVNVALRQTLDLYACVRPCRLYPGIISRFDNVDLVLIRENTEDLYAGIEYDCGTSETTELIEWVKKHGGKTLQNDAAISLKPISARASERIIRFAFEYALKNGRKMVTAVHKANIMKYSDGLFLKIFRQVAAEYDGKIDHRDQLVDSLCMQLVRTPECYDVLVLPNLYGDIISDLCAGLIGGLGVAPGINLGSDLAVFEPVHGSAPDLAGKNIANPTASILSGVLMLRHLRELEAADRLEAALKVVLKAGDHVTADLKGSDSRQHPVVGTQQMAEAIISNLTGNEGEIAQTGANHA
ncbi:MAG: isocitrate/isopropylmalate dehydrogenase family protein [Candidatus Omnitrophota bacterium]|nr:isocitrate/isopropylmalate dehydrogenase family protein [Candidatus Omnitrophota bacterium]